MLVRRNKRNKGYCLSRRLHGRLPTGSDNILREPVTLPFYHFLFSLCFSNLFRPPSLNLCSGRYRPVLPILSISRTIHLDQPHPGPKPTPCTSHQSLPDVVAPLHRVSKARRGAIFRISNISQSYDPALFHRTFVIFLFMSILLQDVKFQYTHSTNLLTSHICTLTL